MVYESSTRRIYSTSPRPVISTSYSYSPLGPIPVVTKVRRQPHLVLAYTPGTSKGHVINPLAIPRVAHRRLMSVSPPPHRALNGQNYYDMLESGLSGHRQNRIILVNYRPTPPPVQQSKVLYIEDVTDSNSYGRGETRILRRELSPSPAPSVFYGSPYSWDNSPAVIPVSRPLYHLHNIPLRSASEVKEIADLRRLYVRDRNPDVGYSPLNKALMYRMPMPVFVDPTLPQSYYIGRGNLACLSFAGGRPISKRRRFFPDYDDKVQDEIIFRSFYTKLRDAAAAERGRGRRPIYQPIYYSRKTILGEENVPKRQPKESKWVERALANEKPPTPRANKAKPSAVAEEVVVAPPRKESLKMERKPATPPSVLPVNVTLPGPRKSITEIIKEDLPKVESLPEEKVTVKMPREPTPAPPTPPVETEETVVLPSKPEPAPREPTPPPPAPAKEPTPPPKEPTPPPPEPAKEPTPPPPEPAKEPTPPPPEPVKEATPPPPEPAKEPTPPPPEPVKEPTPPPPETTPAAEQPAASEPEPPTQEIVAEAESPAPAPIVAEPVSEPASEEVSVPASGDEASNKGEVEDIQLDDEITLDEVCDVEENDLEIESDDQEASQSASAELPVSVESPQVTEGSPAAAPAVEQAETPTTPVVDAAAENAAQAPANDQDAVPPAPVSIVVADIDGPIPSTETEEAPAVNEEPLTVEQIQQEAERRRAEFAQLLEEHAELVTTVKKLERVAVIVSKSCAEALAQQQAEEQQPPPSSSTNSQKSK